MLNNYFKTLVFFYSRLHYRIFLVLFLSLFVGVLDGFGLTMFLPLLQLVSGDNQISGEALGNLGFVIEWFKVAGLSMTLQGVLIVMVFFFALKGLFKFMASYYRVLVQQFFIRRLRLDLLLGVIGIKFAEFIKSDIGRLQNSLGIEIERVSKSFSDYFRAIEQGILVVVYMSFAFFVDVKFAALVSVGGVLTNFIFKLFYNKTRSASTKFSTDSHKYQGLIIQLLTNFKYLKATALLNKYFDKISKSVLNIEGSRKRMGLMAAIMEAMREPLLIIIVASVILFQAKILGAPLAPIMISLLFFYRALSSLVGMQNNWNTFLATSGSLDNVISLNNEIGSNLEEIGSKEVTSFNNALLLKGVDFSYDDLPVLKNINLEVCKNETVAFVGESGSGKTTLLNLISGLVTSSKGEYRIDGINNRLIDMRSFQSRIGYIAQEPVIFNDTIFNNITFWASPTSDNIKRFNKALKMASLGEFVNDSPNQKEMLLGSNGINLSGGQKQRISIARELFKDIDILIMDEATSALDSETERVVQENIESLHGKYTILIIAHRLSTIKNVDRIVMLDKGKIIQIGSYKEMLKFDGFKKMVELQEL